MKDKIKNMKTMIGAHFPYIDDLQLYGVVSDAIQIGANSGSFNISNPKTYNKKPQDLDLVENAHKLATKFNLDLQNFLVHGPEIGNLADTKEDSDIFDKTVDSYLEDLHMVNNAKLKYYIISAGKNKDKELGIERVAEGINNLHELTPTYDSVILIETMVDSSDMLGGTFEELGQIIEKVENKERIGICVDTSNIWSAGYDISNDLRGVLNEFDRLIGLEYIKALHINDSKSECGKKQIRHEDIGLGKIGEQALKEIVHHHNFKNIPKTLETPLGAKDYRKWMEEIELLENHRR